MQVVRLGKELNLAILVSTAEESIISGPWTGQNLQRLISLLRDQPQDQVNAILHRPSRVVVSELEVRFTSSYANNRRHLLHYMAACSTSHAAPELVRPMCQMICGVQYARLHSWLNAKATYALERCRVKCCMSYI